MECTRQITATYPYFFLNNTSLNVQARQFWIRLHKIINDHKYYRPFAMLICHNNEHNNKLTTDGLRF